MFDLFKKKSVERNETFVDVFIKNALKYPNKIALVDEEGSYTYRELNQISNGVAAKLLEQGIGKGDIVPILMKRGKGFVAALIGVLKSGSAFVPIDIIVPIARIQSIATSVNAKVIIDDKWMDNLSIDYDDVNKAYFYDTAMIIFTSGSSGLPKGVIHTHKSLLYISKSGAIASNFIQNKRYANILPNSFIAGINTYVSCLFVGAPVYIASEFIRKDIPLLVEWLQENRITGFDCIPSIANSIFERMGSDTNVNWIALLGENVLSTSLSVNSQLINFYGNSECGLCSCFKIKNPHIKPPIGKPIFGMTAFIIDDCGNQVAKGCTGELCFAGKQVAKGYWQLPELTAEKFVPCPFLPSDVTMYKTGDLARYREDGNIELVGRKDFQIKIRGYRIEPEEIENVALRFEGIDTVVVVAKEIVEEKHLVLYYTSRAEIEEDQLKDHLSIFLADYMVPNFYVRLDEMPHNANGKIDRNGLPEPKLDYYGSDPDKPTTGLEQIIFDAVAKQIGSSDFGINDDLIDLGLTSLSSMILSVDLVSRGVKLSSMEGLSLYNEIVRVRSVKGLAQSLSVEK